MEKGEVRGFLHFVFLQERTEELREKNIIRPLVFVIPKHAGF